jgi:hypothetical protein
MKKIKKWFFFKLRQFIAKYDSTQSPPYIIEERKIQKIQSEHVLTETERKYFRFKEKEVKEMMERDIVGGIVQIMLHTGAIKFEWDYFNNGDRIKLKATTYVPEKL